MTPLYTPGEAERWRRRARRSQQALWCLACGGLAGCIGLCFHVQTGNAQSLFFCVIALSTLAGWAVILLRGLVTVPARAQAQHTAGIAAGEGEEYRGVLFVERDAFAIPRGITVKKAYLEESGERILLQADAGRAARLPANGTRVRVTAVRKYITAFEVCDEQA
jgi:hypothetical protein